MILPYRTLKLSLIALFLLPVCSQGESTNEAIARATAAIEAAAPRAQADPARPVFHVTSPSQWINDPNGPIYHKGFYHLFYQLHPFSDRSGPKYWGHVRSRDLVKWEPLPVALWPSSEAGEAEVWSGCCTINGRGEPMIFYTSIAPGQPAQTHAEQWAAIGDDDLITWRKSPANPVLTETLHGGKKIYEWRDPFVFKENRQTFLVTGGNLNQTKGGQAAVNIYEAQNDALTQWKYRGVLFTLPDASARTAECPNFFKLGGKWVLFVSPYGKVQYFTGDFNAATCRFEAHARGVVDCGRNFYAPNTMQVPDGRRLVWGWINGFPNGHGWNGCLTLPRELALGPGGQLLQKPAPQLSGLRGKKLEWRNVPLESSGKTITLPKTNTFEVRADIEMKTAESIALEFKSGTNGVRPVVVSYNSSALRVVDDGTALTLEKGKRILSLDVFFDRSVLEVFANGTVCATRTIAPLDAEATLEIRAETGSANVKLVQAWPIKTIW